MDQDGSTAGVAVSINEGAHVWTLDDWPITQITFDPGGFRLMVWKLTGSAEVRIGVPFRLSSGSAVQLLDAANTPSLAPLLSLMGAPVHGIIIHASGTLEVIIGAAEVTVEPHPGFAAWTAQGSGVFDGFAYRCAPGARAPWG